MAEVRPRLSRKSRHRSRDGNSRNRTHPVPRDAPACRWEGLVIRGAREHNLGLITVRLPKRTLAAVTGVTGLQADPRCCSTSWIWPCCGDSSTRATRWSSSSTTSTWSSAPTGSSIWAPVAAARGGPHRRCGAGAGDEGDSTSVTSAIDARTSTVPGSIRRGFSSTMPLKTNIRLTDVGAPGEGPRCGRTAQGGHGRRGPGSGGVSPAGVEL